MCYNRTPRNTSLPARSSVRRGRRVVGALMTAASALLFVAACFVWWRSFAHVDRLELESWRGPPLSKDVLDYGGVDVRCLHVNCERGRIALSWYHSYPESLPYRSIKRLHLEHPRAREAHWLVDPFDRDYLWDGVAESPLERMGFIYRDNFSNSDMRVWEVLAPVWVIAALTGTPAASWLALWLFRFRLRRRRERQNLCPSCGYDLRASAGCCPESGLPRPMQQSMG